MRAYIIHVHLHLLANELDKIHVVVYLCSTPPPIPPVSYPQWSSTAVRSDSVRLGEEEI